MQKKKKKTIEGIQYNVKLKTIKFLEENIEKNSMLLD
jgi:hypothetical protein